MKNKKPRRSRRHNIDGYGTERFPTLAAGGSGSGVTKTQTAAAAAAAADGRRSIGGADV